MLRTATGPRLQWHNQLCATTPVCTERVISLACFEGRRSGKDPSDEEKQKYNYVDEAAFAEWLKQEKEKNIALWK
jgi:hypothetical protein